MKSSYDVVILGAGHNGLVAATYLAREGLSVLLLEKNDYIGGATISHQIFPDYDARLSRYAYLVSLFPHKIIQDLGLKLELRRRVIASRLAKGSSIRSMAGSRASERAMATRCFIPPESW